MGGKALLSLLPHAAFPRLSPVLYNAIKTHIHERLLPLFDRVATPLEAPEKLDHGDVDFIVVSPRSGLQHHDIERALGVAPLQSIPSPEAGAGTSHFALSLDALKCELRLAEEASSHGVLRRDPSTTDVDREYVQVDVHLCPDVEDFDRVVFFHGYGDIGMIMVALSRSVGLQLGSKGLKVRAAHRAFSTKSPFIFLLEQFTYRCLQPPSHLHFPRRSHYQLPFPLSLHSSDSPSVDGRKALRLSSPHSNGSVLRGSTTLTKSPATRTIHRGREAFVTERCIRRSGHGTSRKVGHKAPTPTLGLR